MKTIVFLILIGGIGPYFKSDFLGPYSQVHGLKNKVRLDPRERHWATGTDPAEPEEKLADMVLVAASGRGHQATETKQNQRKSRRTWFQFQPPAEVTRPPRPSKKMEKLADMVPAAGASRGPSIGKAVTGRATKKQRLMLG